MINTVKHDDMSSAEKSYETKEIQGFKRNSPADKRGKQAGNRVLKINM